MGGGGKKGGSSKTYYGTCLYGIGIGPIKLVHCIKVDSVTVWKNQDGTEITGEYKDFSTDVGTCRIFKGSWTQTPDTSAKTGKTAHFADGPAYRGLAYMRWFDLKLGTEKTSTPSIEVECTFADADEGLISPADFIEDMFTDARIGLGASASLFSCDSAIKTATIKTAPKYDSESTLQDMCNDLLPIVWCYARFEGRVLTIKRLYEPPDDWTASSIPALTDDNCLEPIQVTPQTPEERIVQTVVNWTQLYDGDEGDDTEGEYATVAIYQDPGLPRASGKVSTIQADALITEATAGDFAIAKGHHLALSTTSWKATIPIDLYDITATAYMMPVRVWDKQSKKWIKGRVTARTIKETSIELEGESDYSMSIHDSATTAYEAPTFSSLDPVDPRAAIIIELPRPMASQAAVGFLCARGSDTVNGYGATISVDAGANYTYVGAYSAFATYGTLSSAITLSTGSMTIANVTIDADLNESASSAEQAADTILAFIGTSANHEIVSLSTITQGTEALTVSMLRGRMGTPPAAWPSGTPVFIIRRSAIPIITTGIAEPNPVIDTTTNPTGGNTYLFKLPQRVALKIQDADDLDPVSVTVAGEYSRPLPPESVAATGGTTYTGSDMGFTVNPTLWQDEGYSGADFYSEDDLYVVPVLVYDSTRTVLAKRSKGSTAATITSSEINGAIGSATSGTFDIQFYSYVNGRHSKTGTTITITISIV